MENTITITQQMDFWTLYFSTLRFLFKIKIIKIGILIISILSLLTLLLQSISYIDHVTIESVIEPLMSILMVLLIYAAFGFLGVVIVRITRPNVFQLVTYRFTHWGMDVEGQKISFSKPWREFTKISENKNYFFLNQKMDAFVIKKKAFPDAKAIDSFRQLSHQMISKV